MRAEKIIVAIIIAKFCAVTVFRRDFTATAAPERVLFMA